MTNWLISIHPISKILRSLKPSVRLRMDVSSRSLRTKMSKAHYISVRVSNRTRNKLSMGSLRNPWLKRASKAALTTTRQAYNLRSHCNCSRTVLTYWCRSQHNHTAHRLHPRNATKKCSTITIQQFMSLKSQVILSWLFMSLIIASTHCLGFMIIKIILSWRIVWLSLTWWMIRRTKLFSSLIWTRRSKLTLILFHHWTPCTYW